MSKTFRKVGKKILLSLSPSNECPDCVQTISTPLLYTKFCDCRKTISCEKKLLPGLGKL